MEYKTISTIQLGNQVYVCRIGRSGDNGDIVRAVGFVAIYGAYLEERIAEITENVKDVISLRNNITRLSASDQAKHLLTSLKSAYDISPDYFSKQQDLKQVASVLSAVAGHLKDRHVVIHATLIAKSGSDVIIRKNRRTSTEEQVKSKEVLDLANDLFDLQSEIDGLKFPIERLMQALAK